MIKLYYTGAGIFNTPQTNKELSLGGYPSNTEIPNSLINNLFSDISYYSIENNLLEYKAIVIKNIESYTLEKLKFHFIIPENPLLRFLISFSNLTLNNGNYYMETVPNKNSKPYYSTDFIRPYSEETAAEIESLESNKYLGIWICKELNLERLTQLKDPKYLLDNSITLPISEIIKLNIEWDNSSESISL